MFVKQYFITIFPQKKGLRIFLSREPHIPLDACFNCTYNQTLVKMIIIFKLREICIITKGKDKGGEGSPLP